MSRPPLRLLPLLRGDAAPATDGATWLVRTLTLASLALGHGLARLRAPGLVRDCEIADEYSGHHLLIQSGPMFTRLTINGRDFYFDRFTGKYSGTGSGCR